MTVYFADARRPYPAWMRLLKPGFRHCGLIIDINTTLALVMESSFAGLAVVPVPVDGVEDALDLGGAMHSLQSRLVHPLVLRQLLRRPVAPFTCVELVKRAIGVADVRVLTPWQLYRHLGGSHA